MKVGFKVDEKGFIDLLRRDIYSRDDVYIRELLQNAIDSRAERVDLCLHVSGTSEDVVALSCCDNGLGMTKSGIKDQFLNLCKKHPAGETRVFRRFGIGVFTYLAFCREIHVSTRARRGRGWYLKILAEEVIQSLDDISVAEFVESDRSRLGTSILLVLHQEAKTRRIISSLRYWIRGQLPTAVDAFISPAISPRPQDLYMRLRKARKRASRRLKVAAQSYPASAHVLHSVPMVESGFLQVGGFSEGVALCEGGILIEDSLSDLTPSEMSNIPFLGVINVMPGFLDLDAGRSRVRRESDRFTSLRRNLRASFSAALAAHIKRGEYNMIDDNFDGVRIVRQALNATGEPSKLIKEFEKALFFHVRGHGKLSLREIAIRSRGRPIYSYSGDSWSWRLSMGRLKGHATELHVAMGSSAGVLSSKGNVVFVFPERRPGGKILDEGALREYFRVFYGASLYPLGGLFSANQQGVCFPAHWRSKLSIPVKLSIASSAVPGALSFDSQGNAFLSQNSALYRAIDDYLKKVEKVPETTKGIIEAYLSLMSGTVSGTLSKIEATLVHVIRSEPRVRRTTMKELINEIER